MVNKIKLIKNRTFRSSLCAVNIWNIGLYISRIFLQIRLSIYHDIHLSYLFMIKQLVSSLSHAVNCGNVCFLAPSVCVFCLCMKYRGNRWKDLRQIHKEYVFGLSLGRVWRSSSKVKGQGHQGQKRHFFRPFRRPVCSLCLVKHL